MTRLVIYPSKTIIPRRARPDSQEAYRGDMVL